MERSQLWQAALHTSVDPPPAAAASPVAARGETSSRIGARPLSDAAIDRPGAILAASPFASDGPLAAAGPAPVGARDLAGAEFGERPGASFDATPYLRRLQAAAQRCPASRSGEGTVRFCVDADGAPREIRLLKSTGDFALDDSALRCVVPGGAPFPLSARCLVVPLRFRPLALR